MSYHRDRPGVRLTPEERRRFAEIALQLRYELDGLSFPAGSGGDTRARRRHRVGVRISFGGLAGRSARVVTAAVRRTALPLLLGLGGAAVAVGASLGADGPRLALTTYGSFLLAWGLTLAVLRLVRRRARRRSGGAGGLQPPALPQHQTSPWTLGPPRP